MPSAMTAFHIFNNSSTDNLTFNVGSGDFIVPRQTAFDDDSMAEFASVVITAVGPWEAYAESGQDKYLSGGTVANIFIDARLLLNDTGKDRWNDWEMLRYLNTIYRLLGSAINKWSSTILMEEVYLTMNQGSYPLPADYASLIDAVDIYGSSLAITMGPVICRGEFKIAGGSIYSGDDALILQYKYSLPALTATDSLGIPIDFYDGIVAALVAFASGQAGSVSGMLDDFAASTCPYIQVSSPLCRPYWSAYRGIINGYNRRHSSDNW
jgi:hypothetical protein